MYALQAVTVALLFALAHCQECGEDSSPSCNLSKIRLGLEWFTNPDHLPLIVAQKHGIFTSFGLDVELVEPADHWEAEEEILAGRLDVAVTEPLHLAQDAARGKPVLGFSRFLHTDGGGELQQSCEKYISMHFVLFITSSYRTNILFSSV